jgi:hypothetical protein
MVQNQFITFFDDTISKYDYVNKIQEIKHKDYLKIKEYEFEYQDEEEESANNASDEI